VDRFPPAPARRPSRGLPVVVTRFLDTEVAGGVVLVVAAVVALVWANSPWDGSYESLWHSKVTFEAGPVVVQEDLRHFVNEALMALFFLVVGLEIKRELVTGELRDPRVAALPAFAAVGGMVVPAVLYLAVTAGGAGAGGWGIPMATDIAFALGVTALLGARVSAAAKLFLLSLAIVDDIGAIAVIAVFYVEELDLSALGMALAVLGVAIVLRGTRVHWSPIHVALGVACWLALYESGVHPTLAGVAFGLLTPARPLAPAAVARRWALDLSDEASAAEIHQMTALARQSTSTAEHLQHVLHPLSSFFVVPVFALANAGVELSADALEGREAMAVATGVVCGLVVGKLVGVTLASWLAVRLGVASLPPAVTWPQLVGVAALAGIGFTVSLFIADLAFDDADGAAGLEAAAKLAILAASLLASALGAAVLLFFRRAPVARTAPAPRPG
jgi:NhaA family Na+:H+ antiporter